MTIYIDRYKNFSCILRKYAEHYNGIIAIFLGKIAILKIFVNSSRESINLQKKSTTGWLDIKISASERRLAFRTFLG